MAPKHLHLLRGEDAPKLAILDWEMQEMRGPEVCKSLRQSQIEPYVYLIFLTEKSQKDDLLEAFEFGADDYLVKPFDGYELRAKLIVAKRILELQDRLVSMREDLRAQATHDFLTRPLEPSGIPGSSGVRNKPSASREEANGTDHGRFGLLQTDK